MRVLARSFAADLTTLQAAQMNGFSEPDLLWSARAPRGSVRDASTAVRGTGQFEKMLHSRRSSLPAIQLVTLDQNGNALVDAVEAI